MKLAKRYDTESGLVMLHERSTNLPLVDVELCFRTGASRDADGLDGLTRLGWRAWRMGTRSRTSRELDQAIGSLGARLAVEVSSSLVRVRAVVIRRSLEPFFGLLKEMLMEPAFRAADVALAKREAQADLVSLRDSDRGLVARAFRQRLFGSHAYGRSVLGTRTTLRRITRKALVEHWHQSLGMRNAVLGVSGDLSRTEALKLCDDTFQGLPKGKTLSTRLPAPKPPKGREVFIVHRKGRPQSHLVMGSLGSRIGDPDHDAFSVANVAFGGTMASPLWQEVREQRGWSYGVSSRLGADRQRDAWRMHTVPEAENAANCAALQLELFEQFVSTGVTRTEHQLAKQNLIHSHCFDWDTPQKRIEHQVDAEALPFPVELLTRSKQRIRSVTRAASNKAVNKRLSADSLCIVVLGDKKRLEPQFSALPGVTQVHSVRYDKLP